MAKTDDANGARPRQPLRGVFERPKSSGIWWARYHDEQGREHRERVGPKGLAGEVYRKRKTEIAERRFFPERLRQRDPLLRGFIDEYLARIKGTLRSYPDQVRCGAMWKKVLGDRTLPARSLPGMCSGTSRTG